MKAKARIEWLLFFLPIGAALFVWLTPLAFVPVPWPDDSAFYFVAKDLFHWPPQWVMLPQAPFEPSYRIFNFNTMPALPLLIGIGRWFGIDGSFLLKIWPLSAWALSVSLFLVILYRKGLSWPLSILLAGALCLDPAMRWASVLVRPESLIGLFGMALVLGLTFGFPEKLRPRGFWDPVSALLAIAAYCHFNAIHLLFPVVFKYGVRPRRLFKVGWKTALYLFPWFVAVLLHWEIFLQQMSVQWTRLSFKNTWLSSPTRAIESFFQSMGSPEPWPDILYWASFLMWILLILAFFSYGLHPALEWLRGREPAPSGIDFRPVLGWLTGAIWLWHSKPELWFVYYLHLALWTYVGLALLSCSWEVKSIDPSRPSPMALALRLALLLCTLIFGWVDLTQYLRLRASSSWNWKAYSQFVDCVDQRLTRLEKDQSRRNLEVWFPTFPDIAVELSRRHPDWVLTRPNDFSDRTLQSLQHGQSTDAVVVTETLGWPERYISDEASRWPEVHSQWMEWKDYFLNQLFTLPGWKPERYICQRGRWQAFLFMDRHKR